MGFASAAVVPSLLGMVATKMLSGGSKAQAAPAPAPAAPAASSAASDAAVATRQAQASQRAAGAAVSDLGGEDGMTAAKDRAAKRTLLG